MPIFDPEPDYNLEEDFPNLQASGWELTSERDVKYNCIAYAAYDFRRRWEPSKGYYWPPGANREDSVKGWCDAFRVLNYKDCEDDSHEPGFEKIAIYAKDGDPQHVARQLESGVWTSKLGDDEDISHNTLEALEGEFYGNVVALMKRQRFNHPSQDSPQT